MVIIYGFQELDGKPSGWVDHNPSSCWTKPSHQCSAHRLNLLSGHRISKIITITKNILALPWLQCHNPRISWSDWEIITYPHPPLHENFLSETTQEIMIPVFKLCFITAGLDCWLTLPLPTDLQTTAMSTLTFTMLSYLMKPNTSVLHLILQFSQMSAWLHNFS